MSNGAAAIILDGPARTAPKIDPLAASAALWFVVAAAGQWLFAYYVVNVYGVRVAADGLAGLRKSGSCTGMSPATQQGISPAPLIFFSQS